jgi:glycerol-3-phosphate cytidylyltransferase
MNPTNQKTVITYGTFDLFHIGHLNLLRRLKGLGDRLIVGLSTDSFNALKGKKTVISYQDRSEIIGAIKFVDFVFPEENWEQKRDDILRYKADIFAMGDDWKGKFDELSDVCDVVYLPRTRDVSTTEIKQIIENFKDDKLLEIKRSAENLMSLIEGL